jgi:ArsR family transcriptional regulator
MLDEMSSLCLGAGMPKRNHSLSDDALQLVARRFAVLGEPMRLRLLHALAGSEMPVNALVEATGGTQANVSRHLQTLAEAGLVSRRREGLQVIYAIADPSIFELCDLVCGSLEKQVAKAARIFT